MWWTTNRFIFTWFCCVIELWLDSKWLKSTCTTACCVSWGLKRTFGEMVVSLTQNVHKYNTVSSFYWEKMYLEHCWLMLKTSTDSYINYWWYRAQLPPTRSTRQNFTAVSDPASIQSVNWHTPNYSRGGCCGNHPESCKYPPSTIIGQITPHQSGVSSSVWNCGGSTADYRKPSSKFSGPSEADWPWYNLTSKILS